jgi:prepilin-type N-terminal cleavage/methylation domain-containing protein
MKQMLKNNKGFTLVEMAIVLVIIGLLLGGVLKGQELIENSKVKKTVSDINAVSVAYNGYLDRYGKIPGDDGPTATLLARGINWTSVVGGSNNGALLIAAANTFDGGGENDNFWQQVRAAGFISGNAQLVGVAALPRNPFGGLMGLTTGVTAATPRPSVCLGQLPGKAASQIDVQLDDGVPNRGSIRATLGVAGANTVPGAAVATYSEDLQYTVCRAL